MNGFLTLPILGNKFFTIIGGPYHERPALAVGVKMAQEISLPCDINIPTKDFGVPSQRAMDYGLTDTVNSILKGDPVYVGCMAGRGRTGLFLAVLAKAFGIEKPVEYVREHYYKHAVETHDQYKYVANYEVPAHVLKAIRRAKFFAFFRFKKSLTNMTGVL